MCKKELGRLLFTPTKVCQIFLQMTKVVASYILSDEIINIIDKMRNEEVVR